MIDVFYYLSLCCKLFVYSFTRALIESLGSKFRQFDPKRDDRLMPVELFLYFRATIALGLYRNPVFGRCRNLATRLIGLGSYSVFEPISTRLVFKLTNMKTSFLFSIIRISATYGSRYGFAGISAADRLFPLKPKCPI